MLLPLISDCRLVHMWGWELTSPASTFSNCPSLGELNEPVDRGSIKWYPIHQREKGTKSLCSLWLAAVGLTYCERFQIFLLRYSVVGLTIGCISWGSLLHSCHQTLWPWKYRSTRTRQSCEDFQTRLDNVSNWTSYRVKFPFPYSFWILAAVRV